MYRSWRILFFALILFSTVSGNGQTPYFLKFSTNHGLSSNIIYHAIQDRDGYMWFATDKGVCRYDGYSFEQFNLNDGLADNEVIKIQQDKKGRIWFLSLIGKLSFYQNGAFYNRQNCALLSQIPDARGYLNYFAEDEDNLYFGSSSGEVFQLGNDSTFKKINSNPDGVHAIWKYQGQVKGIWKGSISMRKKHVWKHTQDRPLPTNLSLSKLRVFHFKAILICSAGNTIWVYDQEKKQELLHYTFESKETDIVSCFYDSNKKLWVGTRNGVYLAESLERAAEGKWKHFLENCLITNLCEDTERNIWMCTMGKALYFLPHSDIQWIHHPYQEATDQITTTLYIDAQRRLWSGHDNSSYIIHENGRETIQNLGRPSNLERISKIKEINGAIWIIGKSKIRVIQQGDTTDLPYFGNDAILDSENRIWIASNYVYRFDLKEFEAYLKNDKASFPTKVNSNSVIDRRANTLYEDSKGGIWLGMFDGLYYFNGKSLLNLSERHPRFKGKINDIQELPGNRHLLIASDNFGVIKVDLNTQKPVHAEQLSQLGEISCSSITLQDEACWLGTNKGIWYIDLKSTNEPVPYSDLLGLQNLHVLDIICDNNKLFAASSNGLLEFDHIAPEDIYQQASPVFITSVHHKDEWLNTTETQILGYTQNELNIGFKGISFKERGSLAFKYKIVGLDASYQYTSNNEVVLKAIPPGNYSFEVFAINKAGIESESPAVIHFEVLHPYWQKWWFILSMVLILSMLAISAWRIRLAIVRRGYELENARLDEEKKRLELESELSELEQHALRLQMNPHFIFNALNSIKGYYAEKKVTEADEYLSRFSKILRHILENNQRYSSLADELNILHLYLEMGQMRHPEMFDYSISVDPNLNAQEIMIPSLLLQPFVENAIMHGIAPNSDKGEIYIRCALEEELLVCTIQDNGIGYSISKKRKKENEHQSLAIDITRKRLAYITQQEGVDCKFEIQDVKINNEIKGTLVTLKIPANKLW